MTRLAAVNVGAWRAELIVHGKHGKPNWTNSTARTEQDAAEEFLRELVKDGTIVPHHTRAHRIHVSALRNRGWSKTFLMRVDNKKQVHIKLVDQTPKRMSAVAQAPKPFTKEVAAGAAA